jgi:hypothetical protein
MAGETSSRPTIVGFEISTRAMPGISASEIINKIQTNLQQTHHYITNIIITQSCSQATRMVSAVTLPCSLVRGCPSPHLSITGILRFVLEACGLPFDGYVEAN